MGENERRSVVMPWIILAALILSSVLAKLARAEAPVVGAPFAITVTENPEMALSAAFDGTNFLVGIQGDADAPSSVVAQRVGPDGTLIGALISTGHTGGAPFIAFGNTNYLMVWEDDATYPNDDVYGQFINPSGALVESAFPISTDAGEQRLQGVAFNGTHFLVIWSDAVDQGLYGRFVSASGALVGSRLAIGQRSHSTGAAVGSDNQDFLVAWQRGSLPGGGDPHDTMGRIVYSDGSLGTVFAISETASPAYDPVALAYNGSHYLVAWNHDMGPGYPEPTVWDVRGRRVSTSGAVMGDVLALVTGEGDQVVLPGGLASDGDGFLLTWNSAPEWLDAQHGNVYGRCLDANGNLQGDPVLIAGGPTGQAGCGLAYGAGRYLCVVNDDVVSWDELGDVVGVFAQRNTGTAAVYRFWKPKDNTHFYTIGESERAKLIINHSDVYTFEGPAFYAYAEGSQPPEASPVYRFWKEIGNTHFYTISESEKDKLINNHPDVYTFEGPVFYAYAEGNQPPEASPVYRFWKEIGNTHFYTISESEKDKLTTKHSDVFTFEGIAFYAYE